MGLKDKTKGEGILCYDPTEAYVDLTIFLLIIVLTIYTILVRL